MKLAACTFAVAVAVAQIFVQAMDDVDCSACSNLTDVQQEVLASYDNGGKRIVCDPTCLDGVTDPTHCNCEYTIPFGNSPRAGATHRRYVLRPSFLWRLIFRNVLS